MNIDYARIAVSHPLFVVSWLRKKRRGFTNVPVAYIEASAVCNLDCRICFAPGTREKLGIMDKSRFRRIASNTFPYIYSVNFVGYGEPLLNKDITWMARHVRSYGREVHLTTNGSLLGEDLARDLVKAGLTSIAFSLDGATAKTNDAIRAPGSFDSAIRGITSMQKAKKSMRKEIPKVLIDTVITKSNIYEIPSLVDLAKELDVQQINLANLQCRTELMEQETAYSADRNHLLERIEEASRRSTAKEIPFKLPAGFSPDTPTPCYWNPSKMIAITWDGKLRPCCFLYHDNTWALRGRTRFIKAPVLGDLTEEDLLTLWHKPAYTEFRRRAMTIDQKPEECSRCLFAWGL